MKIKTLSKKILALGLACCCFGMQPISAFGDYAHQTLARCAFGIERQRLFRLGWAPYASLMYYTNCVVEASTKPDYDETDGGTYSWHFYSPKYDEQNENTRGAAFWRMKNHFDTCVEQMELGNKERALEYLGRSLHYLQDMCCPVHMWGYEFNGNNKYVCKKDIGNLICGNTSYHKKVEDGWSEMAKCTPMRLDLDGFGELNYEECTARDIGEAAYKFSWELFGGWIEAYHVNYESGSSNFINALIDMVKKCNVNDKFKSYWEKVFLPAYTASHALVCLFIKKVEAKIDRDRQTWYSSREEHKD